MFPNPWQRGQAPNGLLNENRRGSGIFVTNAAGLAFERFTESVPTVCGTFECFENDLAIVLAEADLHGIDQPLAHAGFCFQSIHKDKRRLAEIDIEQRFGLGVFEHPPVLVDPREAAPLEVAELEGQVGLRRSGFQGI